MAAIFIFFLISGFCSLLYEIVWLRLGMAQFGVTTPLTSIVISSFMAGLGIGSWAAGRVVRRRLLSPASALRLYGLSELLIGIAALVVPHEMLWGRLLLERTGWSSSSAYYAGSGVWLALTLAPWCACMGATIPLAMQAMNGFQSGTTGASRRAFSYLYLANVLGALAGSVGALAMVELYGFHGTLARGAGLNFLLAASAVTLSFFFSSPTNEEIPVNREPSTSMTARWRLLLLFGTGLTSMGMEVVWIRELTPYVNTLVYSFACILATYLTATYIGSTLYRGWLRRRGNQPIQLAFWIWPLLGLFGILSLWSCDPLVSISVVSRVFIGIAPFSALLGFVTPLLVDLWAGNDPDCAGRAYAANVAGCIIGPLLAGFVLLPFFGERWSVLLFSMPWLAGAIVPARFFQEAANRKVTWHRIAALAALAMSAVLAFTTHGFADRFAQRVVLRDNTATVIATEDAGGEKRLLVNGVGITVLTPITKLMAHLPLAFLGRPPKNALVICFGMGTTYRSMLSWDIPTTAVELVPSVPKLFWFYHSDGPALLKSPLSHVVIDDGRRYLERTNQQFDVIAIDPPPPVEAAGSSLLYSKEFYATARARLRPDGILQQWLPGGDPMVAAAITKALMESFPYVRTFRSIEGWGTHFLASNRPLPLWSADQLLRQMPPSALKDMMEWGPESTPEEELGAMLKNEISPASLIAQDPAAPALTDDRPVNEYYALRRGAF
jgi:predicted membrane-bound spermidine synthase